jgi:hypothetical protein
VAIARNCFSLQKKFSIRQRFDHPFIGIEGLVCYHDVGVDGGKQQIGTTEIMGIAGS